MEEADVSSSPATDGQAVDGKVWETFQSSFTQVQTILDQNRVLISEINQNHETKSPENLTRNVTLIRELNNNISRVVELYANLSTEFVKSVVDSSTEGEAIKTSKPDTGDQNSPPVSGQKRPRFE